MRLSFIRQISIAFRKSQRSLTTRELKVPCRVEASHLVTLSVLPPVLSFPNAAPRFGMSVIQRRLVLSWKGYYTGSDSRSMSVALFLL